MSREKLLGVCILDCMCGIQQSLLFLLTLERDTLKQIVDLYIEILQRGFIRIFTCRILAV